MFDDPITDRPDVFAPFLEDFLPGCFDNPASATAEPAADGSIRASLSISERVPGDFAMPGDRPIAPAGVREICRKYGYAITDFDLTHRHENDRATLQLDLVFEPVAA